MVSAELCRRKLVASLLALPLFPSQIFAQGVIALEWDDLLPSVADRSITDTLVRIVKEEFASLARQQAPSTGVRTDWNEKVVSLPGFMVPIAYNGTGVTEFILVPYVGACIHVPPPPANQLVLVSTSEPYEMRNIFEPVKVAGTFRVSQISTDLAEIGYAISAQNIMKVK